MLVVVVIGFIINIYKFNFSVYTLYKTYNLLANVHT